MFYCQYALSFWSILSICILLHSIMTLQYTYIYVYIYIYIFIYIYIYICIYINLYYVLEYIPNIIYYIMYYLLCYVLYIKCIVYIMYMYTCWKIGNRTQFCCMMRSTNMQNFKTIDVENQTLGWVFSEPLPPSNIPK